MANAELTNSELKQRLLAMAPTETRDLLLKAGVIDRCVLGRRAFIGASEVIAALGLTGNAIDEAVNRTTNAFSGLMVVWKETRGIWATSLPKQRVLLAFRLSHNG